MVSVYKRAGSPFYQAEIRVDGKSRRFSTKERSRARAEKVAEEREAAENAKLDSVGGITFVEGAARFLREGGPKRRKGFRPSTLDGYKTCCRNIYRIKGDFVLGALTTPEVEAYIRIRKAEGAEVMTLRELSFLSSLYKQAKGWEGGPKTNPVTDADKTSLRDAKPRKGWLRESQIDTLLSNCNYEYQRLLIIMFVNSGLRKMELLALRWDEIEFWQEKGGELHADIYLGNFDVNRTKTGEGRIVPLPKLCVDALYRTYTVRKKENGGREPIYVFPGMKAGSHMKSVSSFWYKLLERTNMKGVRLHDLRHTFASWAKQRGLGDSTVQDLLGHSTASMTKRYSKNSTESLRDAMRRFDHTNHHTHNTVFEKPTGRFVADNENKSIG